MPKFNLNWLYIIVIGALAVMLWQGNEHPGSYEKDISYSEIKSYIAHGYTHEVVVNKTDG